MLMFVCLIFGMLSAHAQCSAPISIGSPAIVHASCPGNGKITVNSVNPSAAAIAPDYYEYALWDTLGTTEILPWQSSNILLNIDPGTYDIRVRRVCSAPAGFSSFITRRVVINNMETMPSINAITLSRQDHGCSNGRFIVSATAGSSTPLQYALVSGITEPEPVSSYVRPRQSSNIFDSLTAGTYYVRVYNACNNAVTQPITITSFTGTVQLFDPNFAPWGCDSVIFNFDPYGHVQIPNTRDTTIVRAWVKWPNNTTDTIRLPNSTATGGSPDVMSIAHISKIDPAYNPAESFWQNLNNFPYTIEYGYRSVCGNMYTGTYVINRPEQRDLPLQYIETDPISGCDSVAVRFRIRYTRATAPAQTLWHYYRNAHGFMYSIDTGLTWTNATPTNTVPGSASSSGGTSSRTIGVLRTAPTLLMVALCGDTITTVINPPALPALSATVVSYPLYSCLGKSGAYINTGNTTGDSLGVEMLSAPPGQPLVPYFVVGGTANYLEQMTNLLPGTYTFKLWDTIGVDCPRSITRTVTLVPYTLTFDFRYNCNGSLTAVETTNPQIPSFAWVRLKLYDAAHNPVLGGNSYMGNTGNPNIITIPANTISTLPDGDYIIRFYKSIGPYPYLDTCAYVEKPWTKMSGSPSLSPSRFIPGCPASTGTIVAITLGAREPYVFRLFDASNNEIAPATPNGNIYNNLNPNSTYNLQVIDSCGTVVNRAMSVGDNLPIFNISSSQMPCVNDNVTFSMDSIPGVDYRWLKNNSPIAGANSHAYTINNIQNPADSGAYSVEVTLGSCVILISNFVLDPDLCGTPLASDLLSFSAINRNSAALLTWTTANTANDHPDFEIQRSEDGYSWSRIGFVPALAGTDNSGKLHYDYTDRNIAASVYYYRLKQLTQEGTIHYSDVRRVVFNGNPMDNIIIYPNPANDKLNITGLSGTEHLTLTSVSGKILKEADARQSHQVLGLGDLSPGVYIIIVKDVNGHMHRSKVNIIR